MSRKRLIDAWRSGHRKGYKLNDVVPELEDHGFVVEQGTKHWKAKHPKLVGSPIAPHGVRTFSAHAFGKQGEIHPDAIRDFLKMIDWIENHE